MKLCLLKENQVHLIAIQAVNFSTWGDNSYTHVGIMSPKTTQTWTHHFNVLVTNLIIQ